jgi:hypothetical protein
MVSSGGVTMKNMYTSDPKRVSSRLPSSSSGSLEKLSNRNRSISRYGRMPTFALCVMYRSSLRSMIASSMPVSVPAYLCAGPSQS